MEAKLKQKNGSFLKDKNLRFFLKMGEIFKNIFCRILMKIEKVLYYQ